MAEGVKKSLGTSFKVFLAILSIVAIVFIIWGATALANNLPDKIKSLGATVTTTPLNAPGAVISVMDVVLGAEASVSWESFILYFTIFLILFFAFSDIVSLFSSFREITSWIIGFGLAVIAGVTNIVQFIAGVFAITAGIGAIGIAIMILAAIFAAVVLNLGVRGPLKKWQQKRQKDIDKFKAEKGFAKVSSFIKGAKEGTEAASGGESNSRRT